VKPVANFWEWIDLESDFGNDLKIDKNRLVIVKIDKYGPVSLILASYNFKKINFEKLKIGKMER
jgi:hypothetical protein